MENRYKSAFLLLSLLFISLINSSLATGAKRMRNDEEASTSWQTNFDLLKQIDGGSSLMPTNPPNHEYFEFIEENSQVSDYRQTALEEIAKMELLEIECNVKKLMTFLFDPSEDTWAHVMKCEAQAELWLKGKVSRLGNSGKMIENWLQQIKNFLDYPQIDTSMSNFDLMLKRDLRPDDKFSKRFRGSWQADKKDVESGRVLDKETYDNARRAFYLGEGYCVYILTEPFDRVEKFVQVLLEKFQHLEFVRNFKYAKKQSLIIVRIYLFRKMCRMFNEPWVPKKVGLIYRYGLVKAYEGRNNFLHLLAENAKREYLKEYDCDWHTVYSRKIGYKFLKNLRDDPSYTFFKESIDESIDELLRHCLPIMQLSLHKDPDNLYKDSPKKYLLPALINQLWLAVSSYELPEDQSINSALEIWSDDNKFERQLLNIIKQNIINVPDKDLTSLYVELLQGHLGDFYSGVFEEPVFNDGGRVVQKALEFLSHIFSLKGYKPNKNISNFLLKFYYFYRISEISNLIKMTDFKEPDETSVVKRLNKIKRPRLNNIKKQLSQPIEHKDEEADVEYDYNNFNITDTASLMTLLDKLASSDSICTPDTLEMFKDVKDDEGEELSVFFEKCSQETQNWLMNKESRLGNIRVNVNRWTTCISNFMNHSGNNLNNLIISQDYRKDIKFQRRIRNTWRTDRDNFDEEAAVQSKYAFYFGDGICVHILAAPFDRVEKFVGAVLKDFSHLKFVRDLKKKEIDRPISVVLYVFQKLCRIFHQVHRSYDHGKIEKNNFAPQQIYGFDDFQTIGSVREKLDYQARNIYKFEKDLGRKCTWFEVFSRKQQYRLLNRLRDLTDIFEEDKINIDASIDEFVEQCLLSFASDNSLDQDIYSKVKSTRIEPLIKKLIHRLEILMSEYHLPHDQSINEALDMRSADNDFKKSVVEDVSKSMFDLRPDNQLATLYIFLLQGNLGHFTDGIFREPIYWNRRLVERKAIEFLFHVFSIRGYKPGVSHPLINLYYLYKMSEIGYLIPIENPIAYKPERVRTSDG